MEPAKVGAKADDEKPQHAFKPQNVAVISDLDSTVNFTDTVQPTLN